jgi:hypothetical protein
MGDPMVLVGDGVVWMGCEMILLDERMGLRRNWMILRWRRMILMDDGTILRRREMTRLDDSMVLADDGTSLRG